MRSFVVKFSQCHFYQVLMIVNAFCISVGFQNDESKMISNYFPSKYLDTD